MMPAGLPIVTVVPGATLAASMTGIGALRRPAGPMALMKIVVWPLRLVTFKMSLRWLEAPPAGLTSTAKQAALAIETRRIEGVVGLAVDEVQDARVVERADGAAERPVVGVENAGIIDQRRGHGSSGVEDACVVDRGRRRQDPGGADGSAEPLLKVAAFQVPLFAIPPVFVSRLPTQTPLFVMAPVAKLLTSAV